MNQTCPKADRCKHRDDCDENAYHVEFLCFDRDVENDYDVLLGKNKERARKKREENHNKKKRGGHTHGKLSKHR